MKRDKLESDLMREEGRVVKKGRHVAYRDHLSYWSLGYGILIDARRGGGITEAEARYLLNNRIQEIIEELQHRLPVFGTLDEARQRALIMMAFQLGVTGTLEFKQMIAALERKDYLAAGRAALASKWAREDSPARAARTAHLLKTGKDPILKG